MGSFNTACFVTRQTITPDDEVVIIPISQSSYGSQITIMDQNTVEYMQVRSAFNSTCYPTCFWGYYGLFLTGKYADYGRFELSRDSDNIRRVKWLLISLKQRMFHTLPGDNKYHDLEALPPSIDVDSTDDEVIAEWDTLYESLNEGRVFVRTFTGSPTQFQVATMLKLTYDELVKMMGVEKLYGGYNCTVNEMIRTSIQQELSMLRIYHHSHCEYGDGDEIASMIKTLRSAPSRTFGGMGSVHLRDLDEGSLSEEQQQLFLAEMSQVLESGCDGDIPPFIKQLMSWQVENIIAHMALALMEVRIEPMYYVGQDYDNTCGKKFKQFLKTISVAHTFALKSRMDGCT